MVLIRVLGSFAAEVGGEPVPLGGPRQRGVLALLVAARGQVVPVDRMAEDLWRGEPPSRALASLQAYVSNLRRLLEPGRPPRTPARLLMSAAPGYALRLPAEAVDAWRFEELLDQARTLADPRDARARLDEALALWRGPAFAEVADEPWAAAEVARLHELRLVARELHVAAGLRLGDPAAVVPAAEGLTRDEPLREEGWRLHALALWNSGRQADALAALRRARATLADELGLDPGPDLVALEEAILTQRTDVLRAAVPAPVSAPAPPRQPPPTFVGRERELATLVTAAGEAATDGARIALVTGEAGLGKSTLLDHLSTRLEQDGWLVTTGRCSEVDSAPPAWAWVEALRTVAANVAPGEFADDLAPLLADVPPVDGDAAAGRFRLRQAVWNWLAAVGAGRPVAVVLDDLHWADATTLELLAGVVGVRAPILVVAAYRADEGERLTDTLASLARTAPLRIDLPGLDGGRSARDPVDRDDGQPERLEQPDHPVEMGLVGHRPGQDGLGGGDLDGHALAHGLHGLPGRRGEVPGDAELVARQHGCSFPWVGRPAVPVTCPNRRVLGSPPAGEVSAPGGPAAESPGPRAARGSRR
ncbi:BTAD domain-containing putative transcriptional regulator [Pseudonocardia thermophila]|uniref:BTAD domain-containing putative transcriptional regulator n=1 Tax=Pseudonocardia thermophila TaxID=1848 RepID=UPI00248E13D2|nr:BTAD domain-containing putative transcriptional regulator [Pseudonocardia thermophila]